MSRSLDLLYSETENSSGLQTSTDYLLIIRTFEGQIGAFHQRWQTIINSKPKEDAPKAAYLAIVSQYYVNYALLVLNSFGLQNALERQPVNIGHFFARCHSCAMSCATLFRDSMAPAGFLKYSPDSHFVQMSYAVLTLLKVSLSANLLYFILTCFSACSTRIYRLSGTGERHNHIGHRCCRLSGDDCG